MTLMELQKLLGDTIQTLVDDSSESGNAVRAKAECVARIAKQMINNADVILRTDKMGGTNERINKIVGE